MEITKKNTFDRRQFIEIGAKGAAGLGLASLPFAQNGCTTAAAKTVNGACYHDCPDRCSWHVTVEDNTIIEFKANSKHPFTAGKLCEKMENFPRDVTFHPDRVLTPLKRSGAKGDGVFEKISWEQAIAEVAEKLQTIIHEKGGEAVLPYSFGGNQGMVQSEAISKRFFAKIGARQLKRTICGDAAVAGVLAVNGQTTGVLPEDIIHSRYIVLWGTNPMISNQHLMPFINTARSNGATLVVVDPFQSLTAEHADLHIQPKPGTDTALALGLIHVILSSGLQDQEYIDQFTVGIDELTQHVEKYNPEYVSAITGLAPEVIVAFAEAYAAGEPSLIRVLIGMEHQANGSSAFRAVAMLPALTGAWKKFGGGLMHMTYEFAGQALNWEGYNVPSELNASKTRSINMVELGKALTHAEPGIHSLIVYNSNPAVTTPNQNLVLQGLRRDDLLTVVLEHFVTDTALFADYIFPATTVLENWDILDSWGTPYLHINEPALEPLGESKPNTEFFRLLSAAMDFTDSYLFETDLDIVKKTLESDHALLKGVTFESLRKSGWAKYNIPEKWMPHASGNFKTASGKAQFYNPDSDPPLPDYQPVVYSKEEQEEYPLQLITPKSTRYFLNSSHANVGHLLRKEGKPCLAISENDAKERGIVDGDELKVFNQLGRVFITAQVGAKVKQGIVSMPQGFWRSLWKGESSANALTHDRLTDQGEGAALHDVRVEVVKV